MVDINKLIRPHLANIETYSSVEPPEVLAQISGIPESKIVKLNGNENPYGPSPRVREAISEIPIHIYPDPKQRATRDALSIYTGFDTEYLIAGAGADEVLDLIFKLFISPGDRVIDCDPTFAMYAFLTRVADAEILMVPRDDNYDIDVAKILDSISVNTKIVFISSPNNPTGNVVSESEVLELLGTGRIVVVDEAYYEFSGKTVSGLVPSNHNLIVLRTLSKWAALAGLRFGYGIMSPKLVQHIIDIKSPYNINVAAEAGAIASLDDAPNLLENVAKIVEERERLFDLLTSIKALKPWPSQGNYILCQMESGDVKEIYKGLAQRGVFVRMFSSKRLSDCFRVAIGKPVESDVFMNALKELI